MGINEQTVLGSALFSATRQAVLALLFGHVDQRFYQKQIIEAVALGSGTVQRELEQLARAGILIRTVEGRQTYFQVNAECPVFDELRGLVRKTFGVAQVLSLALSKLSNGIEVAFVYGSTATGTEKSSSDIDILLIGEPSLMDVVSATTDAQRTLGREINPAVYPVPEFRRKLAEGQHFITRVIKSPKIFLVGDEQHLKRLVEKRLAQRAPNKPGGDRRPARRS